MPRFLPVLYLCLLLLFTACTDNPEPQPTLEGTWTLQSTTESRYNAQNTQLSQTTTRAQPGQLLLATSTSVVEPLVSSPATVYPVATYDSSKQLITYPNGPTLTITELTINTLTVSSTMQVAATGSLTDPPGKLVKEKHFVR